MKYSIYIYEGDLSSSDLRENLMTDAVIAYCGTHDIGYADVTVERAEKGKPYIYGTEEPVYCNVSHSDNLWIAIVGPGECGIDLQRVTDCKYEQIAAEVLFTGRAGIYPNLWHERILPPLGQTRGLR